MPDNLPLRNDDTTFVGRARTEEIPNGSTIHYPWSKIALGAETEDDGPVSNSNPMPIKSVEAINPLTSIAQATISPGGEDDLDSDAISSGQTGKLLKVIVTGSAPFKAELKQVANGVETNKGIGIVRASGEWIWQTPGMDFVKVAQDVTAGFDGFRITVANLDPGPTASDFYATFYYDEITQ